MTVNTKTDCDTVILCLNGDFDLYSAPAIRELMRSYISEGCRKMVLNMEQVGYLDSSGVGVIILGLHNMKKAEGDLVLAALQRAPFRVLEMSNITSLIKHFNSENEALNYIK